MSHLVLRREVISPEMVVIASSLDQTGQNQEDWDRKLGRKWFRFKPTVALISAPKRGAG